MALQLQKYYFKVFFDYVKDQEIGVYNSTVDVGEPKFVEGKVSLIYLYRRLSVIEFARVQIFPNTHKFYYKNVMVEYKMVKNEVPVNLGYYLDKKIF